MIIDAKNGCPLSNKHITVKYNCSNCSWHKGTGEAGEGCLFNGMNRTEATHLIKIKGNILRDQSKIESAQLRIEAAEKILVMWECIYLDRIKERSQEE